MPPDSSPLSQRRLFTLLGVYALIHVIYIFYCCSPVPFWDEWDHFVLFSQDLSRQVSLPGVLNEYWKPDSVHRVPMLKALYMLFHSLPGPSKWLMGLTLVLMLSMFLTVWKFYLARENKTREDAVFFVAIFLFFASWNQGEVYFMGMAIAWFIANFTFVLAYRATTKGRYILAWLPLGISALTQGTWLFAAGAIGFYYGLRVFNSRDAKERFRFVLLGGAFSVVTIAVYALTHFVLGEPIAARLTVGKFCGFLLVVLGSPFMTMGSYVSMIAAVFLLAFLGWMIVSRERRAQIQMPVLIMYGFVGALIVTFGRGAYWKFPDTVGYRYSTFMIVTWVFVFLTIWKMLPPGSKWRRLLLAWLFVSTTISDYKQFLLQWQNADSYTYAGRITLRLLDDPSRQPTAAEKPILETVYPDIERLRFVAKESSIAMTRMRQDLCGSPTTKCPEETPQEK